MKQNLVIIPTYNECENIADIIQAVMELPSLFDVLIVDDSSPDGTAKIVENLMNTQYSGRLFLEVRKAKDGLGRAYIHGFKWAMLHNYQFIYEMDADFSHNPKDLERLYAALNQPNVEMVVGSRYSNGVNVINWDMKRVLLSFFASKYVQIITGIPIHDTTAGFVGYKRIIFEKLDLEAIHSIGYGFQVEMKYRVWAKGFNIVEVPIIFTDRTKGQSKMHGGIIKEAAFGVLRLKMMNMVGKL